MTGPQASLRKSVFGVVLAQTAALFVRSYVELQLQRRGYELSHAKDLSYVVVPPILIVLLWPILQANKTLIAKLFSPRQIDLRLILSAVAIGILARVAWWSQLFVRISFGRTQNTDPNAVVGPTISIGCPSPAAMLAALFVFGLLIPVVEEVINRGLIQTWLMPRGHVFAVLTSAALFAAFHSPPSMPFAFIFGIVFAIQFANTNALWATIITHATYDLLILLDWRCLHGQWNPQAADLPTYGVGILSATSLLLAAASIVRLLQLKRPEAP